MTSAALALGIVALLILVLIRMGGLPGARIDQPVLSTFDVAAAGPKSESTNKPQHERRTERTPKPQRAAPPPPALPPPPIVLPGVMNLSRADFASSNIGRSPNKPADAGEAVASAETGGGGGAEGGAGSGPGGEKLYNAEWYRRPTRAEMATYLPPNRQLGWGMIACRTVDRYHVEDCRELSETPGSGIARALRRASWQFLVRPPRIGGKPQIGAWVRIKFDIVEDAAG